MIHGAIFDADGTLLDSMHIWREAGERYLRSVGKSPEAGLSQALFPMTLEEGSAYLKGRYGLKSHSGEIKAGILDVVADFYRHEAGLKPGARQFLARLRAKGVPMAIATSGDRELLLSALARLGIAGFFRGVLTCSELGAGKREPRIYLEAARLLRSDAAHTAVFEDVLHAIETARRAGFFTVAVEDSASESDRAAIRRAAHCYMEGFGGFNDFWRLASEI